MNFLNQKYLNLYRQIEGRDKNELFFLVVKNLIRIYDNNIPNKILNYLKSFFKALDDTSKIIELTQQILSKREIHEYKFQSFIDVLKCINSYKWIKNDFFYSALSVNFSLFLSNFPPLVLFAFNKRLVLGKIDKNYLIDLWELTYMVLLRLVKLPFQIASPKNTQLLSKQGAVFDIYIDENMVYKVPKTLISHAFLAEQEYFMYNQIKETCLKKFISPEFNLIEHSTLIHNYIKGESGESILENRGYFLPDQITSLNEFYDLYKNNHYYDKFLLDIHPGNFIWSEKRLQWFLIDYGPIPKIGYEYYIFDNFGEYFLKVWLSRNQQKQKIPIRSFDYAMDINIIKNEYRDVSQLLEKD